MKIYHVTRTDIRHNFSVYFYALYLSPGTKILSIISEAAFIPQLLLLLSSSLHYGLFRDPPFCCFVQTFLFVTFNKVVTSQVSHIHPAFTIYGITVVPL
jgi:phosphatidylinositol glycan class M